MVDDGERLCQAQAEAPSELVLIGAAEDVESELGIELNPKDAALETADIFRRLRIRPGELPTEPIEQGQLR